MAVPTLEELNLLHEQICHAVSDPKRIQILYYLHEKPRHVNAIAQDLNMPQPTVSRHLGILRQRGLVQTERDGTQVVYRLTDVRMIEVLEVMRTVLKEALERRSTLV